MSTERIVAAWVRVLRTKAEQRELTPTMPAIFTQNAHRKFQRIGMGQTQTLPLGEPSSHNKNGSRQPPLKSSGLDLKIRWPRHFCRLGLSCSSSYRRNELHQRNALWRQQIKK